MNAITTRFSKNIRSLIKTGVLEKTLYLNFQIVKEQSTFNEIDKCEHHVEEAHRAILL